MKRSEYVELGGTSETQTCFDGSLYRTRGAVKNKIRRKTARTEVILVFDTSSSASRHYFNRSKLTKVVVEGKRHFNIELFHNDFTRAVSEAPMLIVELLKRLPRK